MRCVHASVGRVLDYAERRSVSVAEAYQAIIGDLPTDDAS
jgi:hypothetical protein